MSDIAPNGGRPLKPIEMQKLWRRAVIEGPTDGQAVGGIEHVSRARIKCADVREIVGADLPASIAVRLGAEACTRLLVSADAGTTFLDVRPQAMRVFVGGNRVFAELSNGEYRVFRTRVLLEVQGKPGAPSVEVWEDSSASARPCSREQDVRLAPMPSEAQVLAQDSSDVTARVAHDAAKVSGPARGTDSPTSGQHESAPAAMPSLQVVTIQALRFDPQNGLGSYLLDQLNEDMDEDGRNIEVEAESGLALPPGDYHVFHARYRTIVEDEEERDVAELYLEPLPRDSTSTDEFVSLNQLKYTLERVAEEPFD